MNSESIQLSGVELQFVEDQSSTHHRANVSSSAQQTNSQNRKDGDRKNPSHNATVLHSYHGTYVRDFSHQATGSGCQVDPNGRVTRSSSARSMTLQDLSGSVVCLQGIQKEPPKQGKGPLAILKGLFKGNKGPSDKDSRNANGSKLPGSTLPSNHQTHCASVSRDFGVSVNPHTTSLNTQGRATIVRMPASGATMVDQDGWQVIPSEILNAAPIDESGWEKIPPEVLQAPTTSTIARWESVPDEIMMESDLIDYAKFQEYLNKKLDKFGLALIPIPGDGNCQFESIGQQLDPPLSSDVVRNKIMQYIRKNGDAFGSFVDGDFGHYCVEMGQDKTYGDHITLQAACDVFSVRVLLATAEDTDELLKIEPRSGSFSRTVWMGYSHATLHYDIVVPSSATPHDL